MADRNFPSVRTMNFQHNAVLIAGSFSATAGGITAGTIYGNGFNVTYTGVGDYLITTVDDYRHCVDFGASLGLTTPNVDRTVTCGPPAGGAGAVMTMVVNLHQTAAAFGSANPANAADRISFYMLLSSHGSDAVR